MSETVSGDPEKEGVINKCGCQREVSGDLEKEGVINKCGCQREVSGDLEKEGVVNKCGCQREGNGVRKKGNNFCYRFFSFFLFKSFLSSISVSNFNPLKCF